jgi:transcriptional regulator GlxA family with amidase domain
MPQVIFLVLPQVEILDVAGPLQVLHEANGYGAQYKMRFCADQATIDTAQGLSFGSIEPFSPVTTNDLVIIPGIPFTSVDAISSKIVEWVREAYEVGAKLYSICTGAFILGRAGLLDGRQCTTHWNRVEALQKRFPRARVLTNRLFVEDGSITSSAGIAAGIDLTLSIVEQQYGPRLAAAVAREMVVYLRRDGSHRQESIYLDYRSHMNPGVHRVQDLLSGQPERRWTLPDLADVSNMSERNLTRVFRQTTGISIGEYLGKLRLELAMTLVADPQLTLEAIATRCGFESARQLRRLSRKLSGLSLSEFRYSLNGR